MAKRRPSAPPFLTRYEEPYRELWRSLSPRERLRRAWKLRKRLRGIRNSTMRSLLRAFERERVRYLVISGQACILYGASRFTEDLDLWIGFAVS
jgi:hypothetical protein